LFEFGVAFLIVVLILAIFVGVSAGIAWIFQSLWNGVLAVVFGLPVLTFWQAWGLWFLIGLIGGLFQSTSDRSKCH
jgi:hypothetical protein